MGEWLRWLSAALWTASAVVWCLAVWHTVRAERAWRKVRRLAAARDSILARAEAR